MTVHLTLVRNMELALERRWADWRALLFPVFPTMSRSAEMGGNRPSYATMIMRFTAICCARMLRPVAVWSWVLMPNHVHLILVPETEDSLRACLSKVHRAYAGHIHVREKRTGLRCFIDPPDQWRARSGKGALAVWRWSTG